MPASRASAVNRRRFLSITTAATSVALTGLLSACSSAAPAAPTAAPAAKPAPTSPQAPAAVPTAAGAGGVAASSAPASKYKLDLGGYTGPPLTSQPIKLRVLRQVYAPSGENWWKNMYAQWAEAYPNISFQEETVPYGDLAGKIQTYVAAGDPTDIMMGKGDFVPSYVFNKIALNLSDFLADSFVQDLVPASRAQLLVGSKLYAWPWESSQILVYFNRDLWNKAGVKTPPEVTELDSGWTWQQFSEAWQAIDNALNASGSATKSVYPLAASTYGNGGPGSNYFYEGIYIRSMGDPRASADSTAARTLAGVSRDGLRATGYVDTPEAITGMQFYQNLFKSTMTPPAAVPGQFENQQAATTFGPYAFVARWKDPQTGVKFDFGATSVPRGKIAFNHTSGDAPIISAATKYAPEATAFMAFVHNDTNRTAWHTQWGSMPARASLFARMNYSSQIPLLGQALIKGGYAAPVTPGYFEYFGAVNTAVKDIALGAPVQARLTRVATEIDGLLAKYKA